MNRPSASEIIVPDWVRDDLRAFALPAADLVYESFSEFYTMISDHRDEVVASLAEQLRNPSCEIGINRILLQDGEVAGVYSYVPSGEAALRRMISFRSLLRIPSAKRDASARAAEFARGIEPVPAGEVLWTRLATLGRLRGRGLGLRMSLALIDEVAKAGYRHLYSHVHRENDVSLALHERLGFAPLGGSEYTHIALVRPLV